MNRYAKIMQRYDKNTSTYKENVSLRDQLKHDWIIASSSWLSNNIHLKTKQNQRFQKEIFTLAFSPVSQHWLTNASTLRNLFSILKSVLLPTRL